ncbi:MAG: hypothetical protein ACR2MA_06155 [Egibacteraceae bacterium]
MKTTSDEFERRLIRGLAALASEAEVPADGFEAASVGSRQLRQRPRGLAVAAAAAMVSVVGFATLTLAGSPPVTPAEAFDPSAQVDFPTFYLDTEAFEPLEPLVAGIARYPEREEWELRLRYLLGPIDPTLGQQEGPIVGLLTVPAAVTSVERQIRHDRETAQLVEEPRNVSLAGHEARLLSRKDGTSVIFETESDVVIVDVSRDAPPGVLPAILKGVHSDLSRVSATC